MSKLRQTHFEQEDWNASKDFKSAIIKLEKEVKTWHWWAYYLFFGIGVLYWHISSALKSIGYIKACGLVKRVMCLSLLNRGIWTYIFFSFCRLENNSKFGQNYYNDICCWSRSFFFNPNYKSFAQCESKAWIHCWLDRICCKFWVLNFFFKIERDTAS